MLKGCSFYNMGKKLKSLGGGKILDGETVTLGILWSSKNIIRSAVKEPIEQKGLLWATYLSYLHECNGNREKVINSNGTKSELVELSIIGGEKCHFKYCDLREPDTIGSLPKATGEKLVQNRWGKGYGLLIVSFIHYCNDGEKDE